MDMNISIVFAAAFVYAMIASTRGAAEPGLYISNSTAILFSSNPGVEQASVVYSQPHGRIVGLAIDSRTGRLFWSDVGYQTKGIYTGRLSNSGELEDVTKIISTDIYEVNGVAVDWVSWHVYWTDARKRTIEVAEYDGSNRRTLSISELVCPRGIVVDPLLGYLFWNDQCSRKIERSRLDGSARETFIDSGLYWPNQMTLADGSLYWVDAWNKTLMSADVNSGSSQQRKAHLVTLSGDDPVFGLAVYNNQAFVSTWHKGFVASVSLATGRATKLLEHLGSDAMFSLVYGDITLQKSGASECNRPSKGGCSHLCLPIDGSSYRCSCPSYGGLALDADKKHCRTPETLLLYSLGHSGEVGFIDLDGAATIDKYLIARSLRPVAVTYDPVMQEVYWSDVHEKSIHRAKLDGSDHHVFMGFNQSIGVVDGLALDYKHRRLYFSNMGVMVLQGTGFSWHKIEMVALDGTDRRVVVNSVEKPRGLWLDLDSNYLYYTDWGGNAMVVRCNLDGSGPVVLRAGLDNPNAVAVRMGKVYVADSHANTGDPPQPHLPTPEQNGNIYVTDDSGSYWEGIAGIDLKIPFGMAAHHAHDSQLYVSDWGSEAIIAVTLNNKEPGSRLSGPPQVMQLLTGVKTPMGLYQSSRSNMPEPTTPCTNTDCEEICVVRPLGDTTCTCPSYDSEGLTADQQTCTQPENFLLIADMNSIKMMGLDASDRSLYRVVQGSSYFSNFAGLVYDDKSMSMYFSDVNRRVIYHSKLDGSESNVFYHTNHVIDGLALVPGSALYWTDFLTGTIATVTLKDSPSYKELVKGLSHPRAIRLDSKNSYIYWTEWGTMPRVARANLEDGSNVRTLVMDGLKKPNGLYLDIDLGHMYIGDGEERKVFRCYLDGSECVTLSYVTEVPLHIFDLEKFGNFLYLTDWYSHSVIAVSMETGDYRTVVADLMRPTVLHIKFLGMPECPVAHGCSDQCLAYLGGYICTCSAGRQLTADQKTCVDVDNPYVEVGSSRCAQICSPHNTCAQKVGTTDYQCHCQPGYEPNQGTCRACEPDHFKVQIGPESCEPCPTTSSSPQLGSTFCQCDGGLAWNWKEASCDGDKPGSCPSHTAPPGYQCDALCNSDSDCSGAKKCCYYGGCPQRQCVDPTGLDECVYDGVPYQPGLSFNPNDCVLCQCTYDKREGDPKYGYARCSVLPCQPVPCSRSVQIVRDGKCCPVCPEIDEIPLEFVDCPSETVRVPLGPDKGYVNYDPKLRVRDNTRLKRDVVITRFPVSNRFWWIGSGQENAQTVTIKASAMSPLGTMQSATCVFRVLVVDDTPPNITCAIDVNIYTAQSSVVVVWPHPTVQENVGLMAPPASEPRVGKSLEVGVHTVSYTVTDKAGHTSSCTFKVHILKQVFKCPAINMYPIRGQLNCGSDTCSVKCQADYHVDEWYNVADVYTCLQNGWTPKFIAHFDIFACVRIVPPRWQTSGKVVIPITSPSNRTRDIGATLEEVVKKQRGWQDTFTIMTDLSRQVNAVEIQFTLKATENAENDTSSKLGDDLLGVLDGLKVALADWGADGSLTHDTIGIQCSPGQQRVDLGCLVCPAGSFHQPQPSVCLPCPANTYQEQEGQTSCEPCPDKGTSPPGSYSRFQCAGAQPQIRQSASSGLGELATVGIACGVILFLLLVIIIVVFLALRSRRNHKKPKPLPDDQQMQFDNDAYMEATGFPTAELPGASGEPPAPPIPAKVALADDNSNTTMASAQDVSYLTDTENPYGHIKNTNTPEIPAPPPENLEKDGDSPYARLDYPDEVSIDGPI